MLDRVHTELSPLGRDLFRRLVLDGESIATVCASTGMSTSAVQAWSSRLKRLLARLSTESAPKPTRSGAEVDT